MTVSLATGFDSIMGPSNGGSLGTGVQNVLNNLASFVRNFPVECHRHVIVITFILRSKHHTNIQIEIQELEGGVKATGLFCLLGIGIGLGSLFVYKLYTRLFPKTLLPPSSSSKLKRPNSGCRSLVANSSATHVADKTLAETPDSGILADTAVIDNVASNIAVASNPETNSIQRNLDDVNHLRRRRNTVAEWLARTELASGNEFALDGEFPGEFFGNQRDMMKSMRSWRSSGYISTDQLHAEGVADEFGIRRKYSTEKTPACFTLDEDAAYDEVLSITDHILVPSVLSESPEDDLSDLGADDLGISTDENRGRTAGRPSSAKCRHRKHSAGSFLSADVPRLWLRRNRHSFSSDLSSGSGYTYRESLVSKGFSIDLGEDLTGIMTPPDGETGGLDHWTMSSMDQLHRELKKIQEDIDYMNEKVVLLSKDDGVKMSVALSSGDDDNKSVGQRTKVRHRSRSFSPARSRSCSTDHYAEEELESLDFIWDYHSDLALDRCDKPMFVVKRPCHMLGDAVHTPPYTENLELETISNGSAHCGSHSSRRQRSNDQNSFREGSCFDDVDGDVIVDAKSASATRTCVRAVKASTQSSVCCDADRAVHSSQTLTYDHFSSLPGVCVANPLCGHSLVSSQPVCCHEKIIFVHPHNLCPGCHDHQRGRVSSARSCHRSDQLPSASHCDACRQNYTCCQSPPVRHCVNLPVVRCQSAVENKQSSSFRGASYHGDGFHHQCAVNSHVSDSKHHLKKRESTINNSKVKVIGSKISIRDYQVQELDAYDRHHEMKKCYDLLNRIWGVTGIHNVYSDNYGGLRAVMYQILMRNLPRLNRSGSFERCVQKLALSIDSGHSYLANWRFGDAISLSKEDVVLKMTECIRTLFEQFEAVSDMSSMMCREQYLLALLNHSPEMDLTLLEGLKILMMLKAIELFDDYIGQKNAPSFVLQLFTKESSKSPELFFNNHINMIGNTAPMTAVEMCLLGLTLDVRIEIIRPYCFNREGFVVHYPDEGADCFMKVHIVEEEHGQFCIPVMRQTD